MTEKELVDLLEIKGLKETSSDIGINQNNQRTFTGVDIYGNDITVTFAQGQDSYNNVDYSIKNGDYSDQANVSVGDLDLIEPANFVDTMEIINKKNAPERSFTEQVTELGYQYEGSHDQSGNHGFGTLDGWTNRRVEYSRENEDGTTTKIEYFYDNSSLKFTGVRVSTFDDKVKKIKSETFDSLESFNNSIYAQANNLENMYSQSNGNLMDIGNNASLTVEDFKTPASDNAKSSDNIKTTAENIIANFTGTMTSFANNISRNILSNSEEATFNKEAYESFKNLNIKVNLEDVKTLRNQVSDAASYFNDDIITFINDIFSSLEELNPNTKEKLQSIIDLELTLLLIKKYRSDITEKFNDLIAELTQNMIDNGAIDDSITGSTSPIEIKTEYKTNQGGGGGHSGGSADPTPVEDVTPVIPINQDNLDKLTPAIAGMITFTEIVSMYTSIGSENPVQSSLTGDYGLLGLVHQNDKYYYKIIDKSNGQVYFVEMNDKAKITWDDRGERATVEIIGEGVNILKLPQEGDVLVRNPEIGDVYFLNGEKMTFDGIDYYFISDSVTGEVAYIPLGSGVSEPTLVSNLDNTSLSDNLSEVIG